MIVTYALKDIPTNGFNKSSAIFVADMFGLNIPAIDIAGATYADFNSFLQLFRFPSSERKQCMSTVGYWKKLFARDPKAVHGVLVTVGSHYYADWGLLISATRHAGVVTEDASGYDAFAVDKSLSLFKNLYKGVVAPPNPVTKVYSFQWDQFYEVIPSSISGRSWDSSKAKGLCNIPVPVPVPTEVNPSEVLVKAVVPDDATPPTVAVDCSKSHPVDKQDVQQSLVVSAAVEEPVTPTENRQVPTSIQDITSLISALTAGKKLSISITLELK